MMQKFILWAQALDNTSPDHFDFRGEELSADDSSKRQDAVSLVSNVTKNGVRVYDDGCVLLTADNYHFVLEVPSMQRDRAGRVAPIVCYGDYDAATRGELGNSVVAALDVFVQRIGRTLRPEYISLARDSFGFLKKKPSMIKVVRMIGIMVVILVLLVIVYKLV